MLSLDDVATAIADNTRRPRGWIMLGAPHTGQGRDATFDRSEIVAWCEEGADASRTVGNAENAKRWQGYADALRADAPA